MFFVNDFLYFKFGYSLFFTLMFMEKINSANNETEDRTDKKVDMVLFSQCFEDIGCIEVTKEWYHPQYRPVNYKPLERHVIKTEFLILGSDDSDTLVFEKASANARSISNAGFQRGSDVIIAIHDFTSNGYTGWIKHLGSAVLEKYPLNMISVDWEAGAEPPFDQAIANARVVALEIIVFINMLLTLGTCKDDIHLIGHGVGAHIAGYVGQEISGLKKITGLDPTGPRFEYMPEIVRLHAGCAKYVEVLHTDYFQSVSQGSGQFMGDADFFVNNADIQPGCKEVKHHSILKLGRQELLPGQILPGCSHKRAFKYFIESIENRDCIFVGVQCPDYQHFLDGRCITCMSDTDEDLCITFGLSSKHNITSNSSFYLNTAAENPFCLYTYAISVELDSEKSSYTGYFEMFLTDEDNHVANLSFPDQKNKYRTYKPKSENTYLYYASHPKLSRLKEAKVKWNKKKTLISKLKMGKDGIPVKKITFEPITRGPVVMTLFKPEASGDTNVIPNGVYRTFKAYEIIPKLKPKRYWETSPSPTTYTTIKYKNEKKKHAKTTDKAKRKKKKG
ncbi:pancreatic lipase-related protein 2-like isoform X1 [Coccinella septempunctata]|uniref:pancreatic lipase-related protein 2-like isoform X1 n=1 Tax=Coccinella septempunctata TaxID=41139 RepID=UPI001D073903|nr:pancreatic lipase-related protein 2-like isoform X1 [Coccinella septempunctata]